MKTMSVVDVSEVFPAVYRVTLEDGASRLATVNLDPGFSVYGEKLVRYRGREYRLWDAYRSKLAASILKGLKNLPIKPGCTVLYLGVATGTTCSHVSDIVGLEGHVYGVEFAPRVMREFLMNVSDRRRNVTPIMADARLPETYQVIPEAVDVVYCDVAQPHQAKILLDNVRLYLKDGGWIMLAIKAASIDVTREPSEVYRREIETLRKGGLKIMETLHLEPYDKAHAMVTAEYRP